MPKVRASMLEGRMWRRKSGGRGLESLWVKKKGMRDVKLKKKKQKVGIRAIGLCTGMFS